MTIISESTLYIGIVTSIYFFVMFIVSRGTLGLAEVLCEKSAVARQVFSICIGLAVFLGAILIINKMGVIFWVGIPVAIAIAFFLPRFLIKKHVISVNKIACEKDWQIQARSATLLYWFIGFSFVFLFSILSPINGIDITEKTHPGESMISIAHSVRAGNISIYIDESGRIPRLNQNIGQSIFSAIPAIAGIKSPQISLLVWKGVVHWLLISMIYSYLTICQGFKPLVASLGVLISYFCGSALSLNYASVTDTGSTLALIVSADTIAGLVYFLFALICLRDLFSLAETVVVSFLYFLIGLVLNIFGAHFLVILLPLIVIFIVIRKRSQENHRILMAPVVMMFFGAILGSLFGGMFLPIQLLDNVFIPGVLAFQLESTRLIDLRYFFLNAYTPDLGPEMAGFIGVNYSPAFSVYTLIYIIFPLLGFCFAWFSLALDTSKSFRFAQQTAFIKATFIATIGGGVFLASSVRLNGYIWEMSRFISPGIFLGILLFVSGTIKIYDTRNIKVKALLVFFVLISLVGPLKSIYKPRYGDSKDVLIHTNQVACGGWLPNNYRKDEYEKFCAARENKKW